MRPRAANAFERTGGVAYRTGGFVVTQNGNPIRLDASALFFGGYSGAAALDPLSPAEEVALSVDENPSSGWTAVSTQPWLTVSPALGFGPARLTVAVDPAIAASLPDGVYTGGIDVTAEFASQTSRRLPVSLRAYTFSALTGYPSGFPRGNMDTPAANAVGLTGAIPVTGFALDAVDIAHVRIYRSPMPGDPSVEIVSFNHAAGSSDRQQVVYIGETLRVKGARPDVLNYRFGGAPQNRRAGWGLMLLSNVLPGGGNGPFTLSAHAENLVGLVTLLGRKTVTFANATAIEPFGTIDTPAQGETVSGTITNFGWVLTPAGKTVPFNGSTIKMYIDGIEQPAVAQYNQARPDVKAYFPGLGNSDGPGAHFTIDTTQFSDGVHTIAWVVTDDAGVSAGIGSRFFTIQNQ